MQQGAVLARLAKEPAQGHQLRARPREALNPVESGMNDGQICVTPTQLELEKAGLVASELAEPAGIADRQRRDLLRRLRKAQRAEMAPPDYSSAGLPPEGVAPWLQADPRWLEAREWNWTSRKDQS
jgi:hypothetical protein